MHACNTMLLSLGVSGIVKGTGMFGYYLCAKRFCSSPYFYKNKMVRTGCNSKFINIYYNNGIHYIYLNLHFISAD